MKSKIRHLGIAYTVSFLFSLPYLTRYTDPKNRMLFFWHGGDVLAMLLAVLALALVFFAGYELTCRAPNPCAKEVSKDLFVIVLGVSCINYIKLSLLKISFLQKILGEGLIKVGVQFLWIFLFVVVGISFLKGDSKIRTNAKRICLILSPIIPLLTLNLLACRPWVSDKKISVHSERKKPVTDAEGSPSNTYIFIFDGWSYQRSYAGQEVASFFKNLDQLRKVSVSFPDAYSPADATYKSMPNFIFQNDDDVMIEKDQFCFRDGEKQLLLRQAKSIFDQPHQEGVHTVLGGTHLPYADFLGEKVDWIESISTQKVFGEGVARNSVFHLVKLLSIGASALFYRNCEQIVEIGYNQLHIDTTRRIHQMALSVIAEQSHPTMALFHYPIPHYPFIYTAQGPKSILQAYPPTVTHYKGNLAYLDKLIGEIIAQLKEADEFDKSLIIMTSDHSWRHEFRGDGEELFMERRHVPLFVKFPNQTKPIEVNTPLVTSHLFSFLRDYKKEM
ncbi:MAG: sulfatase-like hydrolase/transferase [Candidatus Omnitrophica bacterium]|nr:sulfatase-like hydrolase/transferase [Candidatus Omnitrophota bacterium]